MKGNRARALGVISLTLFAVSILLSKSYFQSQLEHNPTTLALNTAVNGVLKVNPSNPRYFTDDSGKAIYLTGSHTWSNLRDRGVADPPAAFDFNGYLNYLESYNHNFIRLWAWDLTKFQYSGFPLSYTGQMPWIRTGTDLAIDGKPKFDLNQFDQTYFDRLRQRVIDARDRGIYVSIMLFEGHETQHSLSPWRWDGHPFNANNNINGVNGDTNGDNIGIEIHSLPSGPVKAVQEAYIKKVIDTVNDLDNVMYEIINEAPPDSQNWQYGVAYLIKIYECTKPKQHLVGMTVEFPGGNNSELYNSPADWISPVNSTTEPFSSDPPASDGRKIVVSDDDHLGHQNWDKHKVWKTFLRGNHMIHMDPYPIYDSGSIGGAADEEGIKWAMGYTLRYSQKINLALMTPSTTVSSTGYALEYPGQEYLTYNSTSSNITLDLSGNTNNFEVEWFNPVLDQTFPNYEVIQGGSQTIFTPPFTGPSVLYLKLTSQPVTTPTPSPTPTATPTPEPTPTPTPEPTPSPTLPPLPPAGNHSLRFDGTNDFATLTQSSTLHFVNSDVSVAFWMKRETGGEVVQYIIGDPVSSSFGYGMDVSSAGVPRVAVRQGGTLDGLTNSQAIIPAGQWVHIAFSIDDTGTSTIGKFYVNGVERWTDTSNVRIGSNFQPLIIGKRPASSSYYKGELDDIQIYDRVLTPSEISQIKDNSTTTFSGIKAYLPFNEGSGQTVSDQTGFVSGVLGANSNVESSDPTWIDPTP